MRELGEQIKDLDDEVEKRRKTTRERTERMEVYVRKMMYELI